MKIDLSQEPYKEGVAWDFVELTKRNDIQNIEEVTLPRWDNKTFKVDVYIHTNDTMCVFTSDDTIIFCFRDSDKEIKDWLSNMSKGTIWGVRDGAHDGFVNAFEKFKNRIYNIAYDSLSKVKDNFSRVETVICVGYSRGGDLATLCMDYLSTQMYYKATLPASVIKCITFGMAKVFTEDRAFRYDSFNNHTRYEIEGDLAGSVPFEWQGFRHVGKPVIIKRKVPLIKWPFFIRFYQGFKRHKMYKDYFGA